MFREQLISRVDTPDHLGFNLLQLLHYFKEHKVVLP